MKGGKGEKGGVEGIYMSLPGWRCASVWCVNCTVSTMGLRGMYLCHERKELGVGQLLTGLVLHMGPILLYLHYKINHCNWIYNNKKK